MSIAASILFDTAYVEAALVTAFELLEGYPSLHRVYFICLSNGSEDDQEAVLVVQHFCARFNEERPDFFRAIKINNTIGTFVSRHFSSAIIYKGLIGSLLAHEPFILNIDAGILPGRHFDAFLRDIDSRLCRPDAPWVIAAHCQDPEGRLPGPLGTLPHHPRYPAGGLLLFNTAAYRAAEWERRYTALFEALRPALAYAEQELMCLMARGEELAELPGGEARVTPFLLPEPMRQGAAPMAEAQAFDCLFFKFIGTLKPWKYWVLDPNKALWTRRRARLQARFPMATIALIQKHRYLVTHENYRDEFLEAFDTWTERAPD